MKTITLGTKITLTIVGLLAFTGTFYANPTSFAPVHNGGPVGVAAAPDLLLVTEYCSQNLDSIDCSGNVTTLATIPGPVGPCLEKYLTIAPSQSANAGFTPRDIFVTQGADIYRVAPDGSSVTHFATIPDAPADHTGITFDHVGTFGYNMIVTTSDDVNLTNGGKVYKVDAGGNPSLIADLSLNSNFFIQTIKGPAVVPSGFGTYGGQLLVADDLNGAVHAIDGSGNVTPDVFDWSGAGAVVVISSATCKFCNNNDGPGVYFQAIENLAAVYQYPPTDFTGAAGSILVTSTSGSGSNLITWDGTKYNGSFFDKINGTYEGSAWTDCAVPPAVPTPSPSATASPAPTAAPTNLSVSAATGTYGGSTTFTATLTCGATPVSGKTITFTLNGNSAGSAVTDATGLATSSSVLLYGNSYNAGNYLTGAAASFAGDSSFGASTGNNSLTVNKAKLLVSADSKTRLYGEPNPPLTASYTGFVQSDTLATSGVTGQPTLTTTATQSSAVGKYPISITQGTLSAGNNYQITFVDGTLTVYLGGIIGLNGITIAATYAVVDSFDSSIGYPASQSQDAILLSNGTIKVQGSTVDGDMVTTGNVILQSGSLVTGDVTYATTLSNSGTVQGSIYQQAPSTPIDAPIPDACGSYTAAPTNANMWITGTYNYNKGDLTVNGNGTATLANGTYCFNSVKVNGNATLRVNGPVTINVTGTFSTSGNAVQNSTNIPVNLQVVSSYTGNNGVSVTGGSATYLTIYAPGTSISVSGGADLFGALVGKTLSVAGNSSVHYDVALPDIWP